MVSACSSARRLEGSAGGRLLQTGRFVLHALIVCESYEAQVHAETHLPLLS